MIGSRVRIGGSAPLLVGLALVLAACNTASPTGAGQLSVTLNGLPGSVTGDVIVAMGSHSYTVTSTTTLSSLTPGTYTETVSSASDLNPIVPTIYDGSASPSTLTVTANTTSSTTVTYAERPGSGQLWLPKSGFTLEVESFDSGSLTASGSPNPDVTVASGDISGVSIAFDHAGNMWVGDPGGHIYRYDATELATSGTQAPTITIDTTDGWNNVSVVGLAFDAAGNLWAADSSGLYVLAYTPAQLATGGAPYPQVLMGPSLNTPIGLAFDTNGDLWVANRGNDTVVEFTPAQLGFPLGGPLAKVVSAPRAAPSMPRPASRATPTATCGSRTSGARWCASTHPS